MKSGIVVASVLAIIVVVVFLFTILSDDDGPTVTGTLPPPAIEQLLILSETEVEPDDDVSVSSTDTLGGWLRFDLWTGDAWEPAVNALQIREVNGTARTIPLGEDFSGDDIGFDSPVTVVVPAETIEGTYRVCDDRRARCATLVVTVRDG